MTSLILPSRRRFLKAATTLIAAPAIVRADNLVKVRSWAGTPVEPDGGRLRDTRDAIARVKPSEFIEFLTGDRPDPWRAAIMDARAA